MNEIIYRNKCILCDFHLKYLCSIKNYKRLCLPEPDSTNVWDMTYGYCDNCYSVQLMTLLDPNILYDGNYFQPLNKSYIWVQHNISFIQFIIYHLGIDQPIIEIGSSSFCIGKHLMHYYKDFTVFDYSLSSCDKKENINYIEGNCETYDFKENSNIIMSHVFEHLYEPKLFIQNCKKNKIQNIFISIPKMNLTNHNINEQHTFLYNENDIEYIFSLYNYKLNKFNNFVSNDNSFHCLFFHFTFTECTQIEQIIIKNRHLYTKYFFENKITIPANSYICPASSYTPSLYDKISNPENIIGVIDINKLKTDKYFGFTKLQIKTYEELIDKDATVIVHTSSINKNIIQTIRKHNSTISILEY